MTHDDEYQRLTERLWRRGFEPPLSSAEAAAALGVATKTMHTWASRQSGPLRPLRIGRRLAWRVEDIRALLRGDPVPPHDGEPEPRWVRRAKQN
ncbi:hypothetical protein BH160DRAFT_4552 [Burkholderia sp. H160]|nr:hypothetical protein BH160DRAFT_4552 [Burkholderia sp. H160]